MMDDYNKRVMAQFDQDVIWLQQHLPPDDVYQFCQQALIGAAFLIDKWKAGEDYSQLAKSDPLTRVWLDNIYGILGLQRTIVDGLINTDMEDWFDENH
jgi:hypothetical protein